MGSDGRGMPSLSGANQRSTLEERDHLIIKKVLGPAIVHQKVSFSQRLEYRLRR